MISAARRTSSAAMPQISATRCGVYPETVRSSETISLDQLLGKPVENREVRPWPDREVNFRLTRRLGLPRVDHDRARRIGASESIELVHPQDRLRLRGVDTDVQDRVAVLDVVDTGRLAIAAECLLQRLPRRCGAKPCVAIEVVRADPTPCDEGQRVIVLEEELTTRVEAERAASPGREQLLGALDDQGHRLVPARCL